jgi:CBS domain-containing protein
VSESESITDAKKKFDRYHGKYNALVLVDEENHPVGIVKYDTLQKYENTGNRTLKNIQSIPGIFGYYTTSDNDAKKIMQEQGINILPIIDSNTHILIGILTSNSLIKKELQYYSTTSLTKLSLEV